MMWTASWMVEHMYHGLVLSTSKPQRRWEFVLFIFCSISFDWINDVGVYQSKAAEGRATGTSLLFFLQSLTSCGHHLISCGLVILRLQLINWQPQLNKSRPHLINSGLPFDTSRIATKLAAATYYLMAARWYVAATYLLPPHIIWRQQITGSHQMISGGCHDIK